MTDPRDSLPARREFGNYVPPTGAAEGGMARPEGPHRDADRSEVNATSDRGRFVPALAIALPTLTVVFAVVMAGFLLAEAIADAVTVRILRVVGVFVLILLIADALSLAFVLGLQSWVERMTNSKSPPPPADPHAPHACVRSRPPPPA